MSVADPILASEVQPDPESAPAAEVRAVTPLFPYQSENRSNRILFVMIALAVTCGYWFFLMSFLAPAPGRPGIDENAYLVAGKNLAQHFTTGFKPGDDYQFLGAMWNRTSGGWYYPKYPFGL